MYGSDDATTIINNCDSYLHMGGMDIKTAQNISLRQYRTRSKIFQKDTKYQEQCSVKANILYDSGKLILLCGVALRLNVPLDEILYMPLGQEIVFRRGQRPIITSRYNILQNELYQKVTKQYEKHLESQTR